MLERNDREIRDLKEKIHKLDEELKVMHDSELKAINNQKLYESQE